MEKKGSFLLKRVVLLFQFSKTSDMVCKIFDIKFKCWFNEVIEMQFVKAEVVIQTLQIL